ncbi:sulfurtransferase TusA family protein [Shewanella psychropiezotolerans]|uniref:Sulfurtransferase TusA family protein n=1 Tax=Shewanella psychropiezotolerans TaxID=2593655 RepID=A0ABX5WXS5_9GAMM|nr:MULTISPECIES: sulfurtransferase TusA family protein [Shewanella]MBE7214885.1 sulfurtransferase TusA family protein [Shewanella benthica]MCL1061927.1 sulfurtransferase TusA family protein [Shewanella benthica]QDO83889.1 sulfurtransferase TusA family protein [Shewanella psychropiezotolerans]
MVFIDLTTLRCPLVLVKVKLALKKLSSDDVLCVSLSDTGSRQDVPRFLKKVGYRYSEVRNDDRVLTLEIAK